MFRRIAALAVVPLLSLACSPPATDSGAGAEADAASVLVAEVNGAPIHSAELDEFIKEELFRSRASSPARLYELREEMLEKVITQRVLEVEAERRGVEPDAVIEAEVEKLGPVRDDEILIWYEENQERLGGATLEQVVDRIRDFLSDRRADDAREALFARAEIVVHLEPPRFEIAGDGPSKGPADAPITIVEFSDFQCPYCRRVLPTLEKLLETYPRDVRVVYRNLPLRSHPRARPAAEAALCAGDQEQFWAYHDKLFENTRELENEHLLSYADELGLDKASFEKCLGDETHAAQVEADMDAARSAGITGTPAFLVNGVLISGAKPVEEFIRVIDRELERQALAGSS